MAGRDNEIRGLKDTTPGNRILLLGLMFFEINRNLMGVKKMETTQINHAEYMRKVRGLSEESLMYIIRDAQAAIKAMPDGH